MGKHNKEINISKVIDKMRAKPAYRFNEKVRDLVDKSEKILKEAADSDSKSALNKALNEFKLQLVKILNEEKGEPQDDLI